MTIINMIQHLNTDGTFAPEGPVEMPLYIRATMVRPTPDGQRT
jgi:hypothetical protein